MSSSAVGTSTDAAQRQLRVDFPAEQSYTSSCLRRVAARVLDPALWTITEDPTAAADVQWSDYDAIDWDAADRDPKSHLVNSYAIRKAYVACSTCLYWLCTLTGGTQQPDSKEPLRQHDQDVLRQATRVCVEKRLPAYLHVQLGVRGRAR